MLLIPSEVTHGSMAGTGGALLPPAMDNQFNL
jgi:hypothetical protein